MSNKISKKITAGVLSILVLGSQLPSGSAHEEPKSSGDKPFSSIKSRKEESNIKLKGIFEIDGLEKIFEKFSIFHYRDLCYAIGSSLKSNDGRVEVKIMDNSFEVEYDKLVNKETGEIDEIEIPYCVKEIGSGVFRDILKKANAQGKKIKKVILPECLRMAAEDIFADVSVDSVVFKSNNAYDFNANIFKNALNIGAIFVPKRFEEEAKADLNGQNIKVYQNFELKNAFDIDGLKDAIMDALANKKDIRFSEGLSPVLRVGDKEFHPDYSKLKNKETGEVENLELPYGISYIGGFQLIGHICKDCYEPGGKLKINRIVIPNTVLDIDKYVFYYINVNHLVLPKHLKNLNREAFGWVISQIGFGRTFMKPLCTIKEITAPAKYELTLKNIFDNGKTEFNFI